MSSYPPSNPPSHLPSHNSENTPSLSSSSSSSSLSRTTTSSYRSPSRSPTTTIRRRRGAVVHKAIRANDRSMTAEAGQPDDAMKIADDVIGSPPQWTRLFQPNPLHSPPPSSPPSTKTTTTPPRATARATKRVTITKAEPPTMSDLPNGTHPSYAQTAAHNAPPPSAQPHPDKNLLYTGPSPTRPTSAPDVENKVSVVPHDWAAHPTTETSLHIDLVQSDTDVDTDENDKGNVSGSTKRKRPRKPHQSSDKAKREVKTFWRHFTDQILHPRPGLIGGVMTFRAYHSLTEHRILGPNL